MFFLLPYLLFTLQFSIEYSYIAKKGSWIELNSVMIISGENSDFWNASAIFLLKAVFANLISIYQVVLIG
jgi:hypothetical protein